MNASIDSADTARGICTGAGAGAGGSTTAGAGAGGETVGAGAEGTVGAGAAGIAAGAAAGAGASFRSSVNEARVLAPSKLRRFGGRRFLPGNVARCVVA